jgi:two-component system, OmpR family, sensor kinase
MSLANRLSGFFLAALALVLGGFSVTLYLLSRAHFQRDLDERLMDVMDVLTASAEVDPGRVEWKPGARPTIKSPHYSQDAPVRWAVATGRGEVVDNYWKDIRGEDLGGILGLSPAVGHAHHSFADGDGRRWRLAVRRIHAGPPSPGAAPPAQDLPFLIVAVGEPLAPFEASLRNVALILAGLSTGIWVLAAAVGRRLCNQALFPMTRMAKAACVMTAADRNHRLPSPGTGDELDTLAGSFNGLLDRLHQEFERQKRFTCDASHQLRTPLTALLGQIEVARRRDRTAEEYERVLDEVHGEAIRLRQIVECLLFMARAETEAERPDLQPLELVSWVHEHLREWSNHERAADLHEDVRTDAPIWVRVHPHLLGQLLDNLLDNSCKYSAPGTPIHVCLWRADDVVALAVQDRGWGMAAQDRSHVFEPFFRSAEARLRGLSGVGLGLAVVQRIAAVFGGTIGVDSELGRGSRFVLRLPDASASMAMLDQAQPPRAIEPARA